MEGLTFVSSRQFPLSCQVYNLFHAKSPTIFAAVTLMERTCKSFLSLLVADWNGEPASPIGPNQILAGIDGFYEGPRIQLATRRRESMNEVEKEKKISKKGK